MKIFVDSDPDGFCGAWVLQTAVEEGALHNPDPTCEVFGLNRAKGFPLDSVEDGETVFIVDYAIEFDEMDALLAKTSEVYWIDHHVSALEKYKDYPHEIKGRRDMNYASCENCYLFVMGADSEMPDVVKYVGDFDTWRWHETGNRSAYLQI